MTTPTDRESVEHAARWLRATGQDQCANTLLALRAALDEAEAALDSAHAEVGSNIWRYWRDIAREQSAKRQEAEARADREERHAEEWMLGARAMEQKLASMGDAIERAAQEARVAALEEAAKVVRHYYGKGQVTKPDDLLALMDTPPAEALERVRAEEREACFAAAQDVAFARIAELQADNAEADDPYGDGLLDEAVSLSEAMLAAIRAHQEM